MSSRAAPDGTVASAFERRAARALALAAVSTTAPHVFRFAAGLYRVQGDLAAHLASLHAEQPHSGQLERDLDRFLERLRGLVLFAAEEGPVPLAEEARRRGRDDTSLSRACLLAFWHGEGGATEDYLSRAMLRPYAEMLASVGVAPDRPRRPGSCPFCGGAAWIAARRASSSAESARRLLVCALCAGEWDAGRLRCPECAEQDPVRLPFFHSDTHPAARVEACESCHRYVKSIDLTVDGRAIPEVDDLASLSLDLWASSQGFMRLEPGLAGALSAESGAVSSSVDRTSP